MKGLDVSIGLVVTIMVGLAVIAIIMTILGGNVELLENFATNNTQITGGN